MTGSIGLWLSLAFGLWLTGLRDRPATQVIRLSTTAGMLVAFASAIGDPAFQSEADGWLWLAALIWWLGLGWFGHSKVGSPTEQRCHILGSRCLVVAGLLAAATGRDWVTLLLAVEIVRRATNGLRESGEPDGWEITSLWTSSLALAGWVFIVGSTDLETWRGVLLQTYSDSSTSSALGRPSYLVMASMMLTLYSALGPVLWTWRDVGATSAGLETTASLMLARQVVATGVLYRVMTLQIPELYMVWWITLVVLVLTTWVMALRWLTDSHRGDVILLGMVQTQGAFLLVWLLSVLDPANAGETQAGIVMSVDSRRIVLIGLVYHTAIIAGLANAVSCLVDLKNSPPFLDEFRGLAILRPLSASCLITALLSIAALPMTAGFWMLGFWLISLLGLHQWRGEILVPHRGTQILLVAGLAMWGLMSAAAFRILRMLLLEVPVGQREFPIDRRKLAVAIIVAGVLWLLGIAPLLFWLGEEGAVVSSPVVTQ